MHYPLTGIEILTLNNVSANGFLAYDWSNHLFDPILWLLFYYYNQLLC